MLRNLSKLSNFNFKNNSFIVIFVTIITLNYGCAQDVPTNKASYYTNNYINLFSELLDKSEAEISVKIEKAYSQMFYGDDNTERIYYPVEPDMAYIYDVLSDDVRSEGMSYGMMIAVQLDKQKEFDRIWKWTTTYMQHKDGQRENYFAWHCKTSGEILDSNSASDGEEWFVTTLFFASARWGDGEGIYNYKAEAQKILDAMLNKVEYSDDPKVVTNMFNKKEKQIVFVPAGEADDFTDPSYHTPHFYQIWALLADKENDFWCDAISASMKLLKNATHPKTGLAPDYSHFDGKPINPWGNHDNFQYDAWRVAMNVAVDYSWFGRDSWSVTQSNTLLSFFYSQGIDSYVSLYTIDGKPLGTDHNPGIVAMNAVAALASTKDFRKEFVDALWNLEIPNGAGRYYDGVLYMLAMLQVSGNFQMYLPENLPQINCNFK